MLEDEKARRRGQAFNWETTTYGKVMYFEDIYYFKDFKNQFPAIVYNDALTSESEVSFDFENEFPTIMYNDALTSKPEVSSEPTVFNMTYPDPLDTPTQYDDLAGKKSTMLVEYLNLESNVQRIENEAETETFG
ncbi:hypothetical protein Tco_0782263 [Tanacetum coccineum]